MYSFLVIIIIITIIIMIIIIAVISIARYLIDKSGRSVKYSHKPS